MPTFNINIKITLPMWRPIPINRQLRIVRIVTEELDIMQKQFELFTQPWKAKDQPTWKRKRQLKGNDFIGLLFTQSTPFAYVVAGTDVRHAVMDKRFKPKTRKGSIRSGSGSPGRSKPFVSKSRVNKPGIGPRRTNFRLAEIRQPKFTKKMSKNVNRFVGEAFLPNKQLIVVPL